MKPALRMVCIAGALLAFLPAAIKPGRNNAPPGGRRFAVPPAQTVPVAVPRMTAEFLPAVAAAPSVHAGSLCEDRDGAMFAAWYGGSREGAADVCIYLSSWTPGEESAWTPPRVVLTRQQAAAELRVPVRKLGNAVLFLTGPGQLRLVFVAAAIGGWSTSSLNWISSADAGQTWTRARVLRLSPLLNISELARSKPAPLADGGWALPIYHELAGKFPEILWLTGVGGDGQPDKTRLFGGRTAFQPALVATGPETALALCRATGGSRRAIFISQTRDAGRSWTPPAPLGLPNPDAAVDVQRLVDGRLLLAFNDSTSGRGNLKLAISADEGRTWRIVRTLEDEPGAEFSYPYLAAGHGDQVHLVYTWKRQAIRHARFNLAWLDGAEANGAVNR